MIQGRGGLLACSHRSVLFQVIFSIEAGRRCESGPGTFLFETQQAQKIFSLIQSNIKRKTAAPSGHQLQDVEKVPVTHIQAHSPLPKVPDLTNMAAILENKLTKQDRRSPGFDDMKKGEEDPVGSSEGPPAPITLMPLPSVPTHDHSSGDTHSSQSDAIYAEPKDCLPCVLAPKKIRSKYIDPAYVLPLKPPRSPEPDAAPPTTSGSNPGSKVLDSVYSEVYDKISPHQKKRPALRSAAKTANEPIYVEPASETDSDGNQTEPKPDPFAHLYAQVCKAATLSKTSAPVTAAASSSTVTVSTSSRDEPLDDVIYENLGII